MADSDQADPTDEPTPAGPDRDEPARAGSSDQPAAHRRRSGATALGRSHPVDSDPDEESGELVEVGAVRAGRRRRVGTDAGATEPKTVTAAPKDRSAAAKPHRTRPVTFVRESVGELRKVVYPTGQQLINYFVVVLVFVLFIIAVVSLLDLAFGAAIFKVFS